jgi:hypothetical protein
LRLSKIFIIFSQTSLPVGRDTKAQSFFTEALINVLHEVSQCLILNKTKQNKTKQTKPNQTKPLRLCAFASVFNIFPAKPQSFFTEALRDV